MHHVKRNLWSKVYGYTFDHCFSIQQWSKVVREHLTSDLSSHVYLHLENNLACGRVCGRECFEIIDTARTSAELYVKEALHIVWQRPELNRQLKHANLSLF